MTLGRPTLGTILGGLDKLVKQLDTFHEDGLKAIAKKEDEIDRIRVEVVDIRDDTSRAAAAASNIRKLTAE